MIIFLIITYHVPSSGWVRTVDSYSKYEEISERAPAGPGYTCQTCSSKFLIAVVWPAHAGKAAVMLNGLDTYVPYNISLYEYSIFYRMLSIFYFFDMYVLKGNHLVFNPLVRLCVKLLQTWHAGFHASWTDLLTESVKKWQKLMGAPASIVYYL
jgi:hypothetical protein